MKMLRENFYSDIRDMTLRILWSQWSALGVFTDSEPYHSALIDPEALICSTMYFGRDSARIFDQSMDWIVANNRLISIDRLKTIAAMLSPETRAALGAVTDYMWKAEGIVKFKNKAVRWAVDIPDEKEPLFRNEKIKDNKSATTLDEYFLPWGFLRIPVKLRHLSRAPGLENPANLRVKLKHIFGIGAKAEVIAFLLLKREGNSNEIADAVNQNQRAVYSELNELVTAGLVSRIDQGRKSLYSTSRDRWKKFLGVDNFPRYLQWAYIFAGLEEVLSDFENSPELYGSSYLTSSRLREITPTVLKLFHNGGVETPTPRPIDYPGEEYNQAFISYIVNVLKELL